MKFVKKILFVLVALFVMANFAACVKPDPTPEPDPVEVTFTGLETTYTFKTGQPFSKDILLQNVQIKDQNGVDYKDKLVINGLDAIQLNEDGTLKQAGSHTVKINVVVDGKTISTKIITVVVEFEMVETNDIIYNGDFALGTKDPFAVTNVDGSVATLDVIDQQLVLSIEALSWQAAFPRIDYADKVELEAGKFYEVQFDAKATVSRHVHVQVGELLSDSPWFYDQLAVQQYFLLTTEMQSFSFRFAATQGQANLEKLSLLFGHGTLPEGYISEVCDVVYDNIKIIEVDSLGADVNAPAINASDKSVYVGTTLDVNALYSVQDDQDTDVEVNVVIKNEADEVVDALDTSKAGVYTITITAKDDANNTSEKVITITVKEKITSEVQIANGDEAASVANGGWIEWHDQNWCGSSVALSQATVSPTELKLAYTMTGLNWFGVQLFYTDANIPAGEIAVEFDINSSVAGDITVAGQKVSLVAGENHVAITGNTSATGATLSMQFGVEADNTCITGGEFVISNLKINDVDVLSGDSGFTLENGEEVKAVENPGSLIEWHDQNWCGSSVTMEQALFANNTLTLSYSFTGSCGFAVQLFLDEAVAAGTEVPVTMKIKSDTAGAITVCGTLVELVVGDNEISVKAVKAEGKALYTIIMGDPESGVSIQGTFIISECSFFDQVVAPSPIDPEPPLIDETLIANGGEEDSAANPGKWIEWHDQNWCGSVYTLNTATYVDGVLTVDYSSTGFCWFGLQLFYTDANIPAGAIKVNMNINASVAGDITIAGQVVSLVEGDNTVEVIGNTSAKGATLGMQFGVLDTSSIAAGKFVISNISIAEYVPLKLSYSYLDKNGSTTQDAVLNEDGTWSFTQAFIQWGRVYDLTFGGKVISSENTTIQGEAYNGANYADGAAKLYQDLKDSNTETFFNSTIAEQVYVFVYDPAANTLTISLPAVVLEEGLSYSGSVSGEATLNEDGTYSAVVTLAKWNHIILTYVDSEGNAKALTKDNTAMSGDIRTDGHGDNWTGSLYYDADASGVVDYTKWFTGVEEGETYTLVYNPAQNTLVVTKGSATPDPDPEPEPDPEPSNNIPFGEEGVAAANPGSWYEWHDQNWCGSVYTLNTATYADGVLTLDYTSTGFCWYGLQLFYKDEAIAAGAIKVTMNINASVAGSIQIAGQVVELVAGDNAIDLVGKTSANGATLAIQFGVEGTSSIGEGKFVLSNISIAEHKEEQGGQEQPSDNQYFTVEAMATTGAANHFMVKWTDADHKVTLEPTAADCSVNIGSVANFELYDLQDSLVRFNIITGAQTERQPAIVLHTAAGDYKITFDIVGGAYSNKYTVEKVECGHSTSEEPDQGEGTESELNKLFTVEAMATAGAANHFMVKWVSADYAVTLDPTAADCSVNIGSVANFELYDLQDSLVRFNIITGAETERQPAIVLHTAAGDYKITFDIAGGAYSNKYTVEKVECGHSTSEEPEQGEVVVDPGNLELIETYIYSGNHAGLRFKVADVTYDASYVYEVTCEKTPDGRVIESFQFGADGIQINYFLGGAAESGVTYVFNIRILSGETVIAEGQLTAKQ